MPITINGTTGISGVDGSAGTPAIIGSDADTGFVFSAGRIQASLNGTSANVGFVSGTAQNSTSGTSIDFTGIPSWAKRITVMFDAVSTNGSSVPIIQLGSSTYTTTGYSASAGYFINGAASVTTAQTTGFPVTGAWAAASLLYGHGIITKISGNTWVYSLAGYQITFANVVGGGSIALSGTLDRVRITTVNGTDTFDAGSINILYE